MPERLWLAHSFERAALNVANERMDALKDLPVRTNLLHRLGKAAPGTGVGDGIHGPSPRLDMFKKLHEQIPRSARF